MRKILVIFTLMIFSSVNLAEELMNQETMESIVKDMAHEPEGEKGVVAFSYSGVKMYLISDTNHDRMRIVAPVEEYKKLKKSQIDAVLESNYHKALDARYAVSDGILYSVYIHPLSDLSRAQIELAVQQVANLAVTFGEEYTSGVLDFGGGE